MNTVPISILNSRAVSHSAHVYYGSAMTDTIQVPVTHPNVTEMRIQTEEQT